MANDASRERVSRSILSPSILAIALLIVRVSFLCAAIAGAYLLWGLFSGGLANFNAIGTKPDRLRVVGNIGFAAQVLKLGIGVGCLAAAIAYLTEETVGFIILGIGLLFYFGIPLAFAQFSGGAGGNLALQRSLSAFLDAAPLPLAIGGLMTLRDFGARLVEGFRNQSVRREKLAYGATAMAESRHKTRVLGKCWEGPYCREFIRTHCPIFHAKKACWRERRGCYCEEDIVMNATAKASGVHLEMAPDPLQNFANPATTSVISFGSDKPMQVSRRIELTMAQKRERCNNCIIYNEHQREKYKVFMPVVLVGGTALCLLFSDLLRGAIGWGLTAIQTAFTRLSFTDGVHQQVIEKPSETLEWVLVAALTVIIVSKALQALEWAVFEAKI